MKKLKDSFYSIPTIKGGKTFKTSIPPETRSLKNLPKNSDGKSRCRFQDWLGIKGEKRSGSTVQSFGKSTNGKWYGWSHRAIYGYREGQTVKANAMVNQTGKDFTVKDDNHARDLAIQFAKEVS
jgi:hypothetical protein